MAYGGSSNIDPVLASMGMPYGGAVTPMGGGMPMGGMGMPFGGMMPGMGGYGANGVPSVPLPPGVNNAFDSGEKSSYGPISPSEDNFNGKVLPPPDQGEKKKRNTQNILLAAGIAISSIALLALTRGRSGQAAKKQAAEDADRLRESNRQQHIELGKEREKSSARKQALESQKQINKSLAARNAVLERQRERTSHSGNVSDARKAKMAAEHAKEIQHLNNMLKKLTPEELAQVVLRYSNPPQNLKALQKEVPWITVPSKATDTDAMKNQADQLCHSIVLHGNKNALPLIQDIGKHTQYLPNCLVSTTKIKDSADRVKVLNALFQNRELHEQMEYPKYDQSKIDDAFRNRGTTALPYPELKVQNADGTFSTDLEKNGTVESFIKQYIEVLHKDGKTAESQELQTLINTKKTS